VPSPSNLLALRPVAALHHLSRGSEACPLSLRDLARALARRPAPLPVVAAPLLAIARGALVAASEADAVVGLFCAGAAAPEPWFEAVAEAAHELSARRPFFVSAVVRVEDGEASPAQGRAFAYRFVEAGITHLAVDVTALPISRRAQAVALTAGFAAEREVAVDCVLPPDLASRNDPLEARAFIEEFEGWGVRADLVSLRVSAPVDRAAASSQLEALAAVGREAGDRPVMRRGPLSPPLLAALRGSGLCACEDGGAALSACMRALPGELRRAAAEDGRGTLAIPPALAERLEALAYGEVSSFIESAGAAGTATAALSALMAGP